MVGSAVAVKKVWKSLRTVKEKLRIKKRFRKSSSVQRRRERYDHYNYSDDDEMDSVFRKKLLKWKVKTMACFVGRAEIEPGKDQFVYVTDLYCSAPSSVVEFCEGSDDIKVENEKTKASTSGNNPMDTEKRDTEESRKSMNSDVGKASPSSSSKKNKTVGWNNEVDLDKGVSIYAKEVDIHADLFIAKFYDDIKLQRQKSLVEYREMLDRGAGSGSS